MNATAAERELLQKYIEANERQDVAAFASVIREDAVFHMPPVRGITVGRDAMIQVWIDGGFGCDTMGQLRCLPTRANLQPAVACYQRRTDDTAYRPLALDVLTIEARRMYETMVYWEAAHTIPDPPQFVLDWARHWQAAEKVVYSRTLAEPRSARTRIEREFDPDAVRRLKADVEHDITVDGPELAAQAVRAGLVDEFQMIVCPVIVGGGKRFFPDGVRLDLEQVEDRRFGNGVVVLRYATHG